MQDSRFRVLQGLSSWLWVVSWVVGLALGVFAFFLIACMVCERGMYTSRLHLEHRSGGYDVSIPPDKIHTMQRANDSERRFGVEYL